MALDRDKLYKAILKIGSPKSKAEAQKKWGEAFGSYMKGFVCISPSVVTDPTKHPDVSKTGKKFQSSVGFTNGTTPAKAAGLMAKAWSDAMVSVILLTGGGYTGSPTNAITSIVPLTSYIAAGKAKLTTDLTKIFKTNEKLSISKRITTIAAAIHNATLKAGGPTTCVYALPGPPFQAVGPIKFG